MDMKLTVDLSDVCERLHAAFMVLAEATPKPWSDSNAAFLGMLSDANLAVRQAAILVARTSLRITDSEASLALGVDRETMRALSSSAGRLGAEIAASVKGA